MATSWAWMAVAGLPLLLIGAAPTAGRAAQAEPAGQSSAKTEQPQTTEQTTTKAPEALGNAAATAKAPEAKRPAGLVGKVIAVTPKSDTIVVDVPLGKETLRIGAMATDQTRILVGGKKASLDALKTGERVRISYYRTNAGDVATSLQVLGSSMG